jgi:hypothetical protein
MKRLILLLCIPFFLNACALSTRPKDVLAPDEMKAVLKDLHLADAYLSTLSDTQQIKGLSGKLYKNVFTKHRTSLNEFNASLAFYSGKPIVLDSMYKQIYDDLKKVDRKNKLPKAVQ